MKRRIMLVTVGVSLASAVVIASLIAGEKGKGGEEDDGQVVHFAEIPAAAQEALRKLAGGAEISEVEVEGENGAKVYEASWTVDEVEHEAEVTAHGEVVATEEVIARNGAPRAVQNIIAKVFPKDAEVIIERKTIVLYELEAEINGEEMEILVAPTGQRIDIDDEDD